MTTTKDDHGLGQAKAQMASIREMVAALECDYDRLEELRDERDSYELACICDATEHGPDTCNGNCGCPDCFDTWTAEDNTKAWAAANPDDAEELAELEASATIDGDEMESADDARERIQQDPLSVEVRSGWYTLDADEESKAPAEFNILLCTGGPACRIMGELENGEPTRAWIQYQDWGTPWTDYYEQDSQDALLAYCRCFYFGE